MTAADVSTINRQKALLYGGILAATVGAPLLFPNFTFQMTVLWVMILFALTWDTLGGQMGYNSLGNIFFFGAGMYTCAIVQIGLYYDVAQYTASYGAVKVDFTPEQYYTGLVLGVIAAALSSVVFAFIFGRIVFGLRGPYFAIGTLGVALSADDRAFGDFRFEATLSAEAVQRRNAFAPHYQGYLGIIFRAKDSNNGYRLYFP